MKKARTKLILATCGGMATTCGPLCRHRINYNALKALDALKKLQMLSSPKN